MEDKFQNAFQSEFFKAHQRRMSKSFYFGGRLPNTPRPSLPLTRLAVRNFAKRGRQDTLEYLDVEKAAEIGRNACVTPTALIMALVYLERLSHENPGYLASVKPSELFVVSLLVASKFVQDDGEELGVFNDEWANSANLELKELNSLEIEFLLAIDWRVKVDEAEYSDTLEKLESQLGKDEGTRRGYFTYGELVNALSFDKVWPCLYDRCVKVVVVAGMAYATLVATVVASSILGAQIFALSKNCLLPSPSTSTLPTTNTVYNNISNPSPLLRPFGMDESDETNVLWVDEEDENQTDSGASSRYQENGPPPLNQQIDLGQEFLENLRNIMLQKCSYFYHYNPGNDFAKALNPKLMMY